VNEIIRPLPEATHNRYTTKKFKWCFTKELICAGKFWCHHSKSFESHEVGEEDDVDEDGDVALELRRDPDHQLTEVWFDSLQVKGNVLETPFCDHIWHNQKHFKCLINQKSFLKTYRGFFNYYYTYENQTVWTHCCNFHCFVKNLKLEIFDIVCLNIVSIILIIVR